MFLQNWLQHRRMRRKTQDLAHHAKHVLHMRGDLFPQEQCDRVQQAINHLHQLLKSRQWDALEEACLQLDKEVTLMKPQRIKGNVIENLEMLIVAIAFAMGLRAYFLQPFKIPTGSMQPTLHGITATAMEQHWTDRYPFKPIRFLITGEWYSEVHAKASGRLGEPMEHPTDTSILLYRIGEQMHRIPRDILLDEEGNLDPAFDPERIVRRGEVLWSGRTQRGDHLFVNKVIWNFRKPRRDDVMVFTTDNIPTLEPGTHYIKRLVGLPEERISIRPPNLFVNGRPLTGYFGIDRITAAENRYAGFQLAGHLNDERLEWRMEKDQYFSLGDNTNNSRDSRYWGPVPAENLVGPAFLVYWPFTRRWGLIR